jgi:hypothetical protein
LFVLANKLSFRDDATTGFMIIGAFELMIELAMLSSRL